MTSRLSDADAKTAPRTDDVSDGRPCPNCDKPSTHAFRPFCSKRCADVDLNRWLSGAYAIPMRRDPEGED